MSESTTVLNEAERTQTWQSTLTGALYRWNEGWQVKGTIPPSKWRLVKPGALTLTVHAHAGEHFIPVTP